MAQIETSCTVQGPMCSVSRGGRSAEAMHGTLLAWLPHRGPYRFLFPPLDVATQGILEATCEDRDLVGRPPHH